MFRKTLSARFRSLGLFRQPKNVLVDDNEARGFAWLNGTDFRLLAESPRAVDHPCFELGPGYSRTARALALFR
jgi:hypothetical protein